MTGPLPLLLALMGPPQDAVPPEARALGATELALAAADVTREIEELRGTRYARPVPVTTISSEEMRQRLEQADPPELVVEAVDLELARLIGTYVAGEVVLTRLLALEEARTRAHYDASTKTIAVASGLPRERLRLALAEELVQALDDQSYDLSNRARASGETTDSRFAFRALLRGSVESSTALWAEEYGSRRRPPRDPSPGLGRGVIEAGFQRQALPAKLPLALTRLLVSPSDLGRAFLAASPEPGAAAARAFSELPRSSEQILHPEKYWRPERRDDPVQLTFRGSLPEEWQLLREDVQGELGLTLWLEAQGGEEAEAWSVPRPHPAAVGWGGDRLRLYGRGAERILFWETTWDSISEANEFFAAVGERQSAIRERVGAAARKASAGFAFGRRGDRGVWMRSWKGLSAEEVTVLSRTLEIVREPDPESEAAR